MFYLKRLVIQCLILGSVVGCAKETPQTTQLQPQPNAVTNSTEQVEASASGTPSSPDVKEGMAYSKARQLLLKAGWHVPVLPDGGYPADHPKVASECAGNVEACNRWPEIDSCSGSGDGYCNMNWVNAAGQEVRVITSGGLDEAVLRSYEFVKPQQIAAPGMADECPSLEFNAFLKAYRERTHLQDIFTDNVVKYTYIDDSGDSPQTKTISEDKNNLDAPLIEAQEKVKDMGIKVQVQQTGNKATVVEKQDGTGFLKKYSFTKHSGCWFLSAINNQSI